MTTLAEVRERHEQDEAHNRAEWPYGASNYGDTRQYHSDRAFLLAEVSRLQALCGRVLGQFPPVESGYLPKVEALLAELREAAK